MRVLFITQQLNLHKASGADQRTRLLFNALQKVAVVDTWRLADPALLDRSEADQIREQYNVIRSDVVPRKRLANLFFPARSGAELPAILMDLMSRNHYDLVVCRYIMPCLNTRADKTGRVIVDIDDHPWDELKTLWSAWRQSQSGLVKSVLWRSRISINGMRKLYHLYRRLPRAKVCFVANRNDARRLRNHNIVTLPNIPVLQELPARTTGRNQCAMLVVATWHFDPNHLGLTAFLKQAWPAICAAVPNATLNIVGIGISDKLRKAWASVSGVNLVGFVENLAEWYAYSSFSIAPIEQGGGTCIKVVESLGYGRTLVGTRQAVRGYEHCLRHEDSLLVADDWKAMAGHCIRLLGDCSLRDRLAVKGREIVAAEFSREKFEQIVGDVIMRAVSNGPA